LLPVTTVGTDKIVTDSLTGLIWRQSFGPGTDFQTAQSACSAAPYAGENDWRLPNHLELASLIRYDMASSITAG
jgi:hypothetical protein